MLEALLALTAVGLLLASRRSLGLGNPFQIYFLIWFLVVLGYYATSETYIQVSTDFLLAICAAKALSLLFLCIVLSEVHAPNKSRKSVDSIEINERTIMLAQVIVTLVLPLTYLHALSLSGGESIFSIIGYIKLRAAFTQDGEGYGILAYSFVFSFIVTSLSAVLYKQHKIGVLRFVFSITVSLFYVYLSTGRTFVLLLFCLIIVPLVTLGVIKLRGLVFVALLLSVLFAFVATMTAKGVSIDESISSNVDSLLTNLRSYTIAPLIAFSRLVELQTNFDLGANAFRFFYALMYSLGILDAAPIKLVKGYSFVPDATNVYTVYEVYFRDFAYFGLFVPSFFLIGHFWLYRRARRSGGVWIFYYSASIYPLIMQFFHDQYFSLFSQWIQIGFWYWIFLGHTLGKMQRSRV